MSDQDSLRTLLEKIDQDRRESEARVERGIQRIEHIIERIADGLDVLAKRFRHRMKESILALTRSMFISSNPPCKLDGPRWVS